MTMRSVHLWAWSTSQALSFMANDRRRLMTVPFPPVVGNWRRWSHSERLNVNSRIWERETGAAIQYNRNSNSVEFILIFSFISVHNLSSMNWIQLTTARLILNTLKNTFSCLKRSHNFFGVPQSGNLKVAGAGESYRENYWKEIRLLTLANDYE